MIVAECSWSNPLDDRSGFQLTADSSNELSWTQQSEDVPAEWIFRELISIKQLNMRSNARFIELYCRNEYAETIRGDAEGDLNQFQIHNISVDRIRFVSLPKHQKKELVVYLDHVAVNESIRQSSKGGPDVSDNKALESRVSLIETRLERIETLLSLLLKEQ